MPSTAVSVRAGGALLKRAAFVIALCAAAAASPAAHAWEWKHAWNHISWNSVSGSGTIKSESRAVSGFTGISLALDALVDIKQGNAEGVTIEADDNILPLIETVVENGTLKIRPTAPHTSFSTGKLKLIVSAKTLDSLAIAGAGDMRADALKAAALKVKIAGAGDVRITSLEAGDLSVKIAGSGDFVAGGRAASLHASVAGSGDIRAGDLDAKAVEISIAGSGDAIVWARETLNVKVAGSGDVKYYGDAEVKRSIVGSGSIKRLGAAPH